MAPHVGTRQTPFLSRERLAILGSAVLSAPAPALYPCHRRSSRRRLARVLRDQVRGATVGCQKKFPFLNWSEADKRHTAHVTFSPCAILKEPCSTEKTFQRLFFVNRPDDKDMLSPRAQRMSRVLHNTNFVLSPGRCELEHKLKLSAKFIRHMSASVCHKREKLPTN